MGVIMSYGVSMFVLYKLDGAKIKDGGTATKSVYMGGVSVSRQACLSLPLMLRIQGTTYLTCLPDRPDK